MLVKTVKNFSSIAIGDEMVEIILSRFCGDWAEFIVKSDGSITSRKNLMKIKGIDWFMRITPAKRKPFLLVSVYAPPQKKIQFFDKNAKYVL